MDKLLKLFLCNRLLCVVLLLCLLITISCLNNQNHKQAIQNTQTDTVIKAQNPKEKILQRYLNLEKDYKKTIAEIEKVINDDNINLAILKENLQQILETIEEEKQRIKTTNISLIEVSSLEKAQQLEDLLAMSKEVLEERLIEMREKDSKLTIDNRKLYNKLKKLIASSEREKKRNLELNNNLVQISKKINTLIEEGAAENYELKALNRERTGIEIALNESKRIIKLQEAQITELSGIINKANINCYYNYETENRKLKVKIHITSLGLPEYFVQYFIRKKPDIFVEFKIPEDLLQADNKIELKLYNSINTEIYKTSKIFNTPNIKIIIPNKNYLPGRYFIGVNLNGENLLIDEYYRIKIAQ